MDPRKGPVARVLGVALLVVGGLAAVATAAALLGRQHWVLELASHFLPQYLVVQALVVVGLLGLGRRGLAVLVVASALPNAVAVGPYLPGVWGGVPALATPLDRDVRLVAANLRYANQETSTVQRYLAGTGADLLVLSEFTPRWGMDLADLTSGYPHSLTLPRPTAWGMALLARHPIREFELLDLAPAAGNAVNIRAVVDIPGGPVELWALHLASPTRADRARLRDAQLKELARRLALPQADGLPRIVAGDLNVAAFSPRFRDFLAATGLRDGRRTFGLQVTWPTWPVPLWIAIDHFLGSDGVVVHGMASGPGIGSDHFPVEVEFSLN